MDFYGVIGLFRDGAAPVLFGLGQNGLLLDILGKVHTHIIRPQNGLGTI